MSSFQPVNRDFAFVLDADVAASELLRAVKSGAGPLLSDIQLFDVYQGKGIEDGKITGGDHNSDSTKSDVDRRGD